MKQSIEQQGGFYRLNKVFIVQDSSKYKSYSKSADERIKIFCFLFELIISQDGTLIVLMTKKYGRQTVSVRLWHILWSIGVWRVVGRVWLQWLTLWFMLCCTVMLDSITMTVTIVARVWIDANLKSANAVFSTWITLNIYKLVQRHWMQFEFILHYITQTTLFVAAKWGDYFLTSPECRDWIYVDCVGRNLYNPKRCFCNFSC